MRLKILEKGHRPLQRALFSLMHRVGGLTPPSPMLVMSYRRDLFGKYIARCFQEGMREATEWSVGEVELFAAFVSRLNECRY